MKKLYVRIAIGIGLAAVIGLVTVGLLVPRIASIIEGVMNEETLSGGPHWVARQLNEASRDEWNAILADARQRSSMNFRIVTAAELETVGGRRLGRAPDEPRHGPPFIRDRAGRVSLYLPLHDGSHYLIAGPLRRPPVMRWTISAIVFVLVLTATASAAVGIPLVRWLRELRGAITALGQGNWAVRLDPDGPLGEVAASVNRTATRLQEQFEEREALLQAVSHEIGTPLSRMRFQVELLDGAVQPEQHARLDALNQDLDELDELATELIGWVETEAKSPARHFDAAEVLRSLIELEQLNSDSTVVIELETEGDTTLAADQRLFQRAAENLLRNARRYAQHRVVVALRAHDADTLSLDVRDDGPGIPPEQWSRVLEPFVRLDEPRSRAQRGLGLGLAIVRRIVKSHGGSISVGAAPEGGTSITTLWRKRHTT